MEEDSVIEERRQKFEDRIQKELGFVLSENAPENYKNIIFGFVQGWNCKIGPVYTSSVGITDYSLDKIEIISGPDQFGNVRLDFFWLDVL